MKKFMAVFVALVVVLQSAPFARSESSVSVVDESRITGTYSGQQFTLQRTFDPVTQDLNKQWFDQAIRLRIKRYVMPSNRPILPSTVGLIRN